MEILYRSMQKIKVNNFTSTRKASMLRLRCAYVSYRYLTTHLVHWKLSLLNVRRLYSVITVPKFSSFLLFSVLAWK
jgi:hypothetical protein